MKYGVAVVILVMLAGLGAVPGVAQQPGEDLRKELEALKESQARMQRELDVKREIDALKASQSRIEKDVQEIKSLLQARPSQPPAGQAAPAVSLNLEGALFKGDKNARVTLVDFTDYQ